MFPCSTIKILLNLTIDKEDLLTCTAPDQYCVCEDFFCKITCAQNFITFYHMMLGIGVLAKYKIDKQLVNYIVW